MRNLSEIPILHITHISNLPLIIADGFLWSDKMQLEKRRCNQSIGLENVKHRRLYELGVKCHAGTMVGDYVPFYFFIHSPMLYYIYKRGFELDYRGGQEDIVYLGTSMGKGIDWAERNNKKWAFSSGNAGARLCDFYKDVKELDKVNWEAVKQRYWNDCKDAKQSEFLVYERFAWDVFEFIGVYSDTHKQRVELIIAESANKPTVKVRRNWYY